MSWEVAVAVVLFALAPGFALWRGGGPERFGASAIVAWYALDFLYHRVAGASGFAQLDTVHLALDLAAFCVFLWLSLRANRLWPLAAVAFQTVPILGHVVMLAGFPGMQRAYWAMTQVPPFFMALLLIGGTLAHRRRLRRLGPYRDWRLLHR